MDDINLNKTNNSTPKPGDVIMPDHSAAGVTPPPPPVPSVATPEPAAVAAPVASAPTITEAPPVPVPEVEETPPAVPPPIEPVPTITPAPSHKMGPIFALVVLVVLLAVGAFLYFTYFKDLMAPVPAPVEVNESTESTIPERTVQEDTTSLQYLENQFRSLDNSTTELTNDTEIQSQLNVNTGTSNSSEL